MTLEMLRKIESIKTLQIGKIEEIDSEDLLWSIELEEGEEVEWVVQYEDGHIERGRLRYSGEMKSLPVGGSATWERRIGPIMIPLTPFTEGPVRVLQWGKDV